MLLYSKKATGYNRLQGTRQPQDGAVLSNIATNSRKSLTTEQVEQFPFTGKRDVAQSPPGADHPSVPQPLGAFPAGARGTTLHICPSCGRDATAGATMDGEAGWFAAGQIIPLLTGIQDSPEQLPRFPWVRNPLQQCNVGNASEHLFLRSSPITQELFVWRFVKTHKFSIREDCFWKSKSLWRCIYPTGSTASTHHGSMTLKPT